MTRRRLGLCLCVPLAVLCLDGLRAAADEGPLLPGFGGATSSTKQAVEPPTQPSRPVPTKPSHAVPTKPSRPLTPSQTDRPTDRQPSIDPRSVPSSRRAQPNAAPIRPAVPPERAQPTLPQRSGHRPPNAANPDDVRRSQPTARPQASPYQRWQQPEGRPGDVRSPRAQPGAPAPTNRAITPQARSYRPAAPQVDSRVPQRPATRLPVSRQASPTPSTARNSAAPSNRPRQQPTGRNVPRPPWEASRSR